MVRCGMNAPMSSAYTGRRAEQVMRADHDGREAVARGGDGARRHDAGMAHAKLDSSGMNARPESPTRPMSRSSMKAARGR